MGLVYAAVYFGKKPIGKMMKFKPTMTSAHKRQAVQNMTWDLYFGYEYFKKWGANQSGSEIMFVSDDKALSSLLNSAIQAQIQLSLKPLEQYLDQANYEYLQVLLPKDLKIKGRTYNSKDWDVDYRKTLIEDLEAKIFN